MILRTRWLSWLEGAFCALVALGSVQAQIDPVERRLIQLGYNQYLQERGPVAGYGFFYWNKPQFYQTNVTLRVAVAPVFVDGEVGFSQFFGPNTDFGIGLAGGGFGDTYAEIRGGDYLEEESFTGHSGEFSTSVYHHFNPGSRVPLWLVLRASTHRSIYDKDSDTADAFVMPKNRSSFNFRSGLRYGGQEPNVNAPLAMELSAWHEAKIRTESDSYGFGQDRSVAPSSHLFWGRALLKYTIEPSYQWFRVSLTAGASANADRFSAYRLGGMLPFSSEFPLNIPGYYFQELSAKKFALLNGQYSLPIDRRQNWRVTAFGAVAGVDYLDGLEQPGDWHSGAGAGVTYTSPSGAWTVTLLYSHGFNAIRDGDRGADNVGLLLQYDFEAKRRDQGPFSEPGVSPYKSRGIERWLFNQ